MIGAWVETYLSELEAAGRRPHTLRGYRGDLGTLVATVEANGGALDEVAVRELRSWLDGLVPATRARRRSAASGFLRWAAAHGLAAGGLVDLLDGPPTSLPGPRVAPAAPDAGEVEAALAAIPLQAELDQLVFGLMARAGLRPGEALALQVEDFDEAAESLEVGGWGGVRRRVLIDDPQVLMRLVNWRRRSGRTSGPMFCAPRRWVALRYQTLSQRWARYASTGGVTVRLGDLRRFHARALLEGGVPEWAVRARLGQRTGPLPGQMPGAGDPGDEIRAWRARTGVSPKDRPARPRSRRDAG